MLVCQDKLNITNVTCHFWEHAGFLNMSGFKYKKIVSSNVRPAELEVKDCCKSSCPCWESNPGQVLLSTESFLQPLHFVFETVSVLEPGAHQLATTFRDLMSPCPKHWCYRSTLPQPALTEVLGCSKLLMLCGNYSIIWVISLVCQIFFNQLQGWVLQ